MIGLVIVLLIWRSVIEGALPPDEADNVLHIGGIFPIAGEGGWQGGQVRDNSPLSVNY